MRFLLALLLPPIAVLSCGKPFQAVINLFLCLLLYIPAIIHALFVVSAYNSDRRFKMLTNDLSE